MDRLISWIDAFNVHRLISRRLRRNDRIVELFEMLVDIVNVEISGRGSILTCNFFSLIPVMNESFKSQQSLSVSFKRIAQAFHQSSS